MLIRPTTDGPFCEAGGFHVDPWGQVEKALITHAHSDHARWGSRSYLCSDTCKPILQERLGSNAVIESIPFGETRTINGVTVSFHPAGHVLGSAQIRIEHKGEVWVMSGDYKLAADISCEAFESVRCHTFVTESTFGLPIYRWPSTETVRSEILNWWRSNAEQERASVLFAYPLGKSQRLLAMLGELDTLPGPMAVHGSTYRLNAIYRELGRPVPDVPAGTADTLKSLRSSGLLIAPQMLQGGTLLRRLGSHSPAFASGWMRIRGIRRRRSLDRGFVISDHADWPGLLQAIEASGASRIGVTHGHTGPLIRYLKEKGLDAFDFPTRYSGEAAEAEETSATSNDDKLPNGDTKTPAPDAPAPE